MDNELHNKSGVGVEGLRDEDSKDERDRMTKLKRQGKIIRDNESIKVLASGCWDKVSPMCGINSTSSPQVIADVCISCNMR